jgi:hypothetical protein
MPLDHAAWRRSEVVWRKQREADIANAHGRFTPSPEPPGDDFEPAGDGRAFAAAGLCETWRMDQGDKTAFFRHSDFPPGFNFSGLWWRKA